MLKMEQENKINYKELAESKAKKRKIIFKKYKKLFRSYFETANFEEPVMILMRRTGKAEFFEKATAGEFKFTHSDGEERNIILTPRFMQTFEYGKNQFKGFVCHEDFPMPLPEDPVLTTEMMGIIIEKTLNDMKKWKTEEWKAKTNFYWKVIIGIAILAGMYILYKMLIEKQPVTPQEVSNATDIARTTIPGLP
jgi:hypothetical protein